MAEKPPAKNRNTGDDRNLIDAKASESGFDLETWVITFWLTNRKTIFTAIVLALVIVVGLQSYRIISAKIEASTRRAFAEATTEEAMKAFAESHKGHALSGAAYLTLADKAYERGEFNQAIDNYEMAARNLDLPVLTNRAELGRAISFIQSGLPSKGIPLLLGLGADEAAPTAIRCEAYHHLASLAIEAEDYDAAGGYLDNIEELAPVGIWASRVTSIRNTLPTVSEPVAPE
jgi:tetratricopeptide (TPR) repeat protein